MSISKPFLLGVIVALGAVALFMGIMQMPGKAAAEPAAPETPGHVDTPGHPEMTIAVVNVAEVFNNLKERAAREEDLNRRKDTLQAEIQKMTAEAEQLLTTHDAMALDDPKRNETQDKIVQLQSDAEYAYKKGMALLSKRELSDRQELYAMIREAIDKYAAENKLTLVLKIDDKRVSDSADSQSMEISQRGVLYSDASLNITAEIIKMLNK